jgi:hypothetical protein
MGLLSSRSVVGGDGKFRMVACLLRGTLPEIWGFPWSRRKFMETPE